MLEELTGYSSFGPVGHISTIVKVVTKAPTSVGDLKILVNAGGSVEIPRVDAAIALLSELGVCQIDSGEIVCATDLGTALSDSSRNLGFSVSLLLFSRLIEEQVLPRIYVEFDAEVDRYFIDQSEIRPRYAAFRNLLLDAKVLEISGQKFLLCPEAKESLREEPCSWRTGMSPEQLMKQLERNEEAGELAEQFVMSYERRRLGEPKAGLVEQVSLVSVSAGFDIASFESSGSAHFDRFIEVKAYGRNGFYFSAGELDAAKRYGARYCLYIINLDRIADQGYAPHIIRDPASYFESCSEWRIVPDRLRITYLSALDDKSTDVKPNIC
ncbi:MAG TPA: DUF3883 domain-containing protein [Candidatus Olsenella pullistercoris]|uniref:DUF3883 domain-containing protein n=1 Tax=Candidatus Olsenella pullistercoris TaxID=2838712 RepID=A0A9D2EYF5_9ACTN|nr:DUF3883 domain-containing protein [Candidatus Olsenella pullistercoris]